VLVLAARADAAPVIDWARGLVVAEGVGVADRHAPNPAVARGTSLRRAQDAARAAIAGALGALPIAGGGHLGERAKDEAVKQRLARAVEHAIELDATPQTDGAWQVTMAVPLEAVRQAIAGTRVLPEDGDRGPAVVVVEGVRGKPAVGWTVGGVAGATLWVTSVPAWAKDAPRVTGKATQTGTIELAGIDATPATLFVIVGKP
jgi:hypothetical protein